MEEATASLRDAPRSLPSRKPVQALGRLSSRKVCPVGGVSKTMWSSVSAPSASSDENSSKEAISVAQAPDSCSRTVESRPCTASRERTPPLCTTLPPIMTAGVALTPERLISSGFCTLTISTSTPAP